MGASALCCAQVEPAETWTYADTDTVVRKVSSLKQPQTTRDGSGWDPFSWVYKDRFLHAAMEMEVVHFRTFQIFGRIPRSTDRITLPYHTLPREQVVLIFVSHRWLQPHGSQLWPNGDPDDDEQSKYQLIIAGIKLLSGMLAPGLDVNNIFLWIDFACIDQTQITARGLPPGICALDYYIQQSDAIFTPVVDPDTSWFKPGSICGPKQDIFNAYGSSAWKEYWMRGWCRLEAFCAAALPKEPTCTPRFRAEGLKGKRPHLLYGTREFESFSHVWILPALRGDFLQAYDPEEGRVTNEADKAILKTFRDKLLPYLEHQDHSWYSGQVDDEGRPHGQGRRLGPDYTVYDGQFQHGKRHGDAKVLYATGMSFEGVYQADRRHGSGREFWPSGQVRYTGEYQSGHRCGHGELFSEEGVVLHSGEFPEPTMRRLGSEGIASKPVVELNSVELGSYTADRFRS